MFISVHDSSDASDSQVSAWREVIKQSWHEIYAGYEHLANECDHEIVVLVLDRTNNLATALIQFLSETDCITLPPEEAVTNTQSNVCVIPMERRSFDLLISNMGLKDDIVPPEGCFFAMLIADEKIVPCQLFKQRDQ